MYAFYYNSTQMDYIPPTSTCIPLIGKYLTFTMLVVTASIITTVMITNLHYSLHDQQMPNFLRKWLVEGVGSRLLISRGVHQEKKEAKAKHLKASH